MAEPNDLCREGLDVLDEVLASSKPPEKDLLAEATRCMSRFRDRLIELKRDGDGEAPARLTQANALLSELVAAEFPLVGVRRERIKNARDAYQRLLNEIAA